MSFREGLFWFVYFQLFIGKICEIYVYLKSKSTIFHLKNNQFYKFKQLSKFFRLVIRNHLISRSVNSNAQIYVKQHREFFNINAMVFATLIANLMDM